MTGTIVGLPGKLLAKKPDAFITTDVDRYPFVIDAIAGVMVIVVTVIFAPEILAVNLGSDARISDPDAPAATVPLA